jgi:formyl-CoA transferase
VPSLIADKTTGLAVVNAVLAALFHRERSGRGQRVEVPMLETMAAFTLVEHLGGLTFRPAPGPPGYARLINGGRRPSRTRDGHIAMLPYTGDHWRAFFEEVGRSELLSRFEVDDRHKRNASIRQLYAALAEITPQRTTAEWMAICDRLDVPASPIYPLQDLPAHPHPGGRRLLPGGRSSGGGTHAPDAARALLADTGDRAQARPGAGSAARPKCCARRGWTRPRLPR